MPPSSPADGFAAGAADLASAPEGLPLRIDNLPADPVLRERLVALGLRPGEVVTVLRRGRPGGILHLSHGLSEFMLRRQQAAEIRVRPA
ncbi:MAG: ferrous iron transport protein A [Cyanobium sp.]